MTARMDPAIQGQVAARAAMTTLGKPGAVAWFIANHPTCAEECTEVHPLEFWVSFDRELSSVSGTA